MGYSPDVILILVTIVFVKYKEGWNWVRPQRRSFVFFSIKVKKYYKNMFSRLYPIFSVCSKFPNKNLLLSFILSLYNGYNRTSVYVSANHVARWDCKTFNFKLVIRKLLSEGILYDKFYLLTTPAFFYSES